MKASITLMTILVLLCSSCVSKKKFKSLEMEYKKLTSNNILLKKTINKHHNFFNSTVLNSEKKLEKIYAAPFDYAISEQLNDMEEKIDRLEEFELRINLKRLKIELNDLQEKYYTLLIAKKVLSNDYRHTQVDKQIENLKLLNSKLGNNKCDQYIQSELKRLLPYLENYCPIYEQAAKTFHGMKKFTARAAVNKDIGLFKKYFKREYPNLNLSEYTFLTQLIEERSIDYRIKTDEILTGVICN